MPRPWSVSSDAISRLTVGSYGRTASQHLQPGCGVSAQDVEHIAPAILPGMFFLKGSPMPEPMSMLVALALTLVAVEDVRGPWQTALLC